MAPKSVSKNNFKHKSIDRDYYYLVKIRAVRLWPLVEYNLSSGPARTGFAGMPAMQAAKSTNAGQSTVVVWLTKLRATCTRFLIGQNLNSARARRRAEDTRKRCARRLRVSLTFSHAFVFIQFTECSVQKLYINSLNYIHPVKSQHLNEWLTKLTRYFCIFCVEKLITPVMVADVTVFKYVRRPSWNHMHLTSDSWTRVVVLVKPK